MKVARAFGKKLPPALIDKIMMGLFGAMIAGLIAYVAYSDWRAERDFLLDCFEQHARRPVRRIFEPACGTGRLLWRLASAGFEVEGNDLNRAAVNYCNDRLRRHGLPAAAWVGDMADFTLAQPADAAMNMINSFRHLPTAAQARAHLRCMADALAPGGIYVLGLHLTPLEGEPLAAESWSARRGNLAVMSRLWTIEVDRRRRRELVGMTFDVYTPTRSFRLEDRLTFRMYTAGQMKRLLAASGRFEILEEARVVAETPNGGVRDSGWRGHRRSIRVCEEIHKQR